MHGLLASLRLNVALRGLLTGAAAVPATPFAIRPSDAAATRAMDPFRTPVRPEPATRGFVPVEAQPVVRPAAPVAPSVDATAATLRPHLPVEPGVPVCAAHLVDPAGLRVVPYRPTSRWPLRRAAPRIFDPFRGFPLRSAHLADLMEGRTPPR